MWGRGVGSNYKLLVDTPKSAPRFAWRAPNRPADTMPCVAELSFFIGKGGVGKTTLASAFALYSADKRTKRPVLLISTDPAHSLADIFQAKFGDSPRAFSFAGTKRLCVWQVIRQQDLG